MNQTFRRQFNRSYTGTKHTPKGESMTEPDQALTVRQLLERQQAGFEFKGAIRAGEYFEDREVPHFEDITEYHAWKDEQEQILKETKKTYEKVQKNRRDLEKKRKEEMEEKPKPPEKDPDKQTKDPN